MKFPKSSVFSSDISNFMSIADHKSLSAAARKTGQDVGNLSRNLARIEREIGSALFSRHQRGLELTEVGEKLYRSLQAAQNQFNLEYNEQNKPRIRIGFSAGIGYVYFSKYFLPLISKGNFSPEFTIKPSIQLLEQMKNRELDLIISPHAPKFPGIVIKKIDSDKMVLCSRSGEAQATLLANAHMLGAEKILKKIDFEHQWLIEDYFVLGKFLEESSPLMGILPEPLLKSFSHLKIIRHFEVRDSIMALSWPGSPGMTLLKSL